MMHRVCRSLRTAAVLSTTTTANVQTSRRLATDVRPVSPRGRVIVREQNAESFTNSVKIGPHELIADEPTDVGGSDMGPSPFEYLSKLTFARRKLELRTHIRCGQLPLWARARR